MAFSNIGTDVLKFTIGADASDFRREMTKMRAEVSGFKTAGTGAFVAVGLAAAGLAAKMGTDLVQGIAAGADRMRQFERQLVDVHQLMDFGADFDKLKNDVQGLSVELTRSLSDTTQAVEKLFSVGLSEGFEDTIRMADQLGKAINLELGTSTTITTRLMNAFGYELDNVSQGLDVIAATIDVAASSGEVYASVMGRMSGTAAAFNISLESMNAIWASLELGGLEAGEAATGFTQLIIQLGKEGTKASKIFEDAAGMGFQEFIDATGGDAVAALQKLFEHMEQVGLTASNVFGSEQRALSAAGLLSTADGIKNMSSNMLEFAESMGTAEYRALKLEQSTAFMREEEERRKQNVEEQTGDIINRTIGDWWVQNYNKFIRSIFDNDPASAVRNEILGGSEMHGMNVDDAVNADNVREALVKIDELMDEGFGNWSTEDVDAMGQAIREAGQYLDFNRQRMVFGELQDFSGSTAQMLRDFFEDVFSSATPFGRAALYPDTVAPTDILSLTGIMAELDLLEQQFNATTDGAEKLRLEEEANNLVKQAGAADTVEFKEVFQAMVEEGIDPSIFRFTDLYTTVLRVQAGIFGTDEALQTLSSITDDVGDSADDTSTKLDRVRTTLDLISGTDFSVNFRGMQVESLYNTRYEEMAKDDFGPAWDNLPISQKEAYMRGLYLNADRDMSFTVPAIDTGGGGRTATETTPPPRITPGGIFSAAGRLASDFFDEDVGANEPLSWLSVQAYVNRRIADDVAFMEETGHDRGFANLLPSDISAGQWTSSPYWYLFEEAQDAEEARLRAEEERQQEIEDRKKDVAERELKRIRAEMDRQAELAAEQELAASRRRIDERRGTMEGETDRLFSIMLRAMGTDQFAAIQDPAAFFREHAGALGHRPMEMFAATNRFVERWDEWFLNNRGMQMAESMWGDGSLGAEPGFGWSADTASTARLFFGGANRLADVVRERDCDVMAGLERTNALLEEGNADRRAQKQTIVNVNNNPMAATTSFVQRQRTDSVIPNG